MNLKNKKILDLLLIIILIIVGSIVIYLSVQNIYNTYIERKIFKEKLSNEIFIDKKLNNTVKIRILNPGGLSFTIKKDKKEIYNDFITKKDEKNVKTEIPSDISYNNSIIYIPGFLEKSQKAKLIFPENDKSIEEDLKKGVRVSPSSKKPHLNGITFIEGHSGILYENGKSYSYFDNLSLFYDDVALNQEVYIETENYQFKYKLFKKEIIEPGAKEFYESNFNHLILMTCYPRNTTLKRALFHGKLISIKSI